MPNQILHKRRNQPGVEPTPQSLVPGELAINTADGKVFTKKENGTVISLVTSEHTHAGTDITTGIVPAARLGTGTADTTTFLRGDNTWQKIVSWQLDGQNASYVYFTENTILLDEGTAT